MASKSVGIVAPPNFKISKKDFGKIRMLQKLIDKHGVDSPDDLPLKLTGGGKKQMKPTHLKAMGWFDSIKSALGSVGRSAWNIVKDVGKEAFNVAKKGGKKALKAAVDAGVGALATKVPLSAPVGFAVGEKLKDLIGDGKRVAGGMAAQAKAGQLMAGQAQASKVLKNPKIDRRSEMPLVKIQGGKVTRPSMVPRGDGSTTIQQLSRI